MEIISTQQVKFEYAYANEAPQTVLRGVDLTVEQGSFVALLGSNGSGKSTLAKHFNAILLPVGGKIWVQGMDTVDEALLYEIRRTVGMVLQNPDNQLVSSIVEEDVAFGPENLGVEPAEIRKRVDEALETVGMTEYIRHEPHRLSGGQKQRIAIAGVIAMRPECMIFDESTAMLDPIGRREVMATIQKLNREENITVINITHYMDEAAMADRVIIFNDGRFIMDGTPEEVFAKQEELVSLGLDVPQSVALANKLKKAGIKLEGGTVNADICAETICKALGGID